MHRATNTNTTQAVLQSGEAEVTQDDQGLFECASTVPGTPSSGYPRVHASITLLTPAVASCSDNTHREGGNKYIWGVSGVNALKRETKLH